MIDIEHIYLFSKKTIKKLLLKTGFNPILIFDIANRYSLNYWIRMGLLNGYIKGIALSILRATSLGKKTLKVKAGNIAIFARKEI